MSATKLFSGKARIKTKTPKATLPRTPRNFFMVYLSAQKRKELEKACRANGTTLKTMAYNAVHHIGEELKSRKGLGSGGGIWLPLKDGDFRALKYFEQHFSFPGRFNNPATYAQFILRLALSQPAIVKGWWNAMIDYAEAEALPSQEKFLADSVATRREYRRVKVGAK